MSQGAIVYEIPVRRLTGEAARGPAVPVYPNEVVEVSAIADNVGNAYVSTVAPSAVTGAGPRSVLTPSAVPRVIAVSNLSEIWVYAVNVNDGVLIIKRKR